MIQFLADSIDQLDLALDQLALRDRNFDRFALMLVDNVAELTLHRFAQDRASENELWTAIHKPKYDPKTIRNALGPYFDKKAKFAAKLALIDDATCESILNLHAFRNTAYHRGLRHERILHSLTWFYLLTTCALLKQYKPRYWSWTSSDVISHRAKKYLGASHSRQPEKAFCTAYDRLAEVAGAIPASLADDLSADMEATIDEMDTAIQFLADDSPEGITRDEVVVHSQAWAVAFTDEAKSYARTHGCKERTVRGYVTWLIGNFSFPFRSDPVTGWRSRVKSLRKDSDNHRALKKYCDFMRQTDSLRSSITEAAVQLDLHIENEINRARGK